MEKINIYLVANEEELGDDRLEIGNFVRNLNDKYGKSCNVYFKLINDERFMELKEDEIKNSNLFYILFCNKLDDKKMEKFKIAYDNFMDKHTPKISTYAKITDKPIDEMRNLFKDFEEQFGHDHNNYENVDTVKLNFVLKLQNFGLPLGEVKAKDGRLLIGDDEIMSLDNIPMFFNNKDLQNLKSQIKELEEEYWNLKEKRLEDDSEEIFDRYLEVSEKLKKAKEDSEELERNIISLESSIVKMSSEGKLSARQIYAKRCVEDGDIKEALEALDLKEITDEAGKTLFIQKSKDEPLKVNIKEIIQIVEILEQDVANEDRYIEIDNIFKEAIEFEKKGNVEKYALEKYFNYLFEKSRFEEAREYGEQLERFIEYDKWEKEDEYMVDLYKKMETCCRKLSEIEEADKYHEKSEKYARS